MSGEDNILKLIDEQPEDPGYRLEEQVGFLLRRAHQRHVAIFGGHIGDLTPPQFAALARLREVGEASQNQLGATIAMDAATVKGVIDRLKARGLVELDRSDTDRRRLQVRLTPEGRALCDTLVGDARAISEETLSPLSASERESLLKLLAKLV
jgi:DNA-binding MarR family transcriptional regulator